MFDMSFGRVDCSRGYPPGPSDASDVHSGPSGYSGGDGSSSSHDMHTAQQIVGWLCFWDGGVFSRLMILFGLVYGHALLGGVWFWGFRGLAGDLYIYFTNVQGLVCAFKGWASCCMGGFMSVVVFDVYGGMCVATFW